MLGNISEKQREAFLSGGDTATIPTREATLENKLHPCASNLAARGNTMQLCAGGHTHVYVSKAWRGTAYKRLLWERLARKSSIWDTESRLEEGAPRHED